MGGREHEIWAKTMPGATSTLTLGEYDGEYRSNYGDNITVSGAQVNESGWRKRTTPVFFKRQLWIGGVIGWTCNGAFVWQGETC